MVSFLGCINDAADDSDEVEHVPLLLEVVLNKTGGQVFNTLTCSLLSPILYSLIDSYLSVNHAIR